MDVHLCRWKDAEKEEEDVELKRRYIWFCYQFLFLMESSTMIDPWMDPSPLHSSTDRSVFVVITSTHVL